MNNARRHRIDVVFVVALLGVFTASVLLTLVFGSRSYSAMKKAADSAYSERTPLSYVTEKLRQGDAAGAVSTGSFGDGQALFIAESVNGTTYETVIYTYGGSLCELYREKGLELDPAAGEKIIEADGLSLRMSDGLLRFTVAGSDGREYSSWVCLEGGRVLS